MATKITDSRVKDLVDLVALAEAGEDLSLLDEESEPFPTYLGRGSLWAKVASADIDVAVKHGAADGTQDEVAAANAAARVRAGRRA